MIRLQAVREENRDLLWNINQKYLYEMTMYYPDSMDENGNYHYGHFDEYFTDPRREAFFLYNILKIDANAQRQEYKMAS